jgi:DNA anti-recombination protein RmuC
MDTTLTYQKVLELIAEQAAQIKIQQQEFQQQSKEIQQQSKEIQQQSKEFQQRMIESDERFDRRLEKSRLDFDKKLGELSGTWGKFVAEMVKPKIVELFKARNIQIVTSMQNIEGFIGDERHYEIDLLLINSQFAVVVEI